MFPFGDLRLAVKIGRVLGGAGGHSERETERAIFEAGKKRLQTSGFPIKWELDEKKIRKAKIAENNNTGNWRQSRKDKQRKKGLF